MTEQAWPDGATRGTRLWIVVTLTIVFLLPVPLLVRDLAPSLHEVRVLRSAVACEAATADCLTSEQVTLGSGGPLSWRTGLIELRVTSTSSGDSTLLLLLPADARAIAAFGSVAVLHRVDGKPVALSRTTSSERVPLASAGAHALLLDGFVLLMLIGLTWRGRLVVRDCRRAGLGWSARVPFRLAVRRRPADPVMLVGGTGVVLTLLLATYDVRVWASAALLVAAIWAGPAINRRLRTMRGVGRHAA